MNWQTLDFEKIDLKKFDLETLFKFEVVIPPDQSFSTLQHNPEFLLATKYLLCNLGLTLTALVWGLAMLGGLLRYFDHKKQITLPALTAAVLSIATGFAIIFAELFLLALTHHLDKGGVQAIFAFTSLVAVGLLVFNRIYLWSAIVFKASLLEIIAGTLFLLSLLFVLFASSTSPTLGDSTGYHAPYADFFLQQRGLAVNEHLTYPYHAFNFNLLYSLGLMLHHSITYLQSIHALFAVFTMFGVYVFCRHANAPVFLCVMAPFVYQQIYAVKFGMMTANVDLGVTFFTFACVFAFWLWYQTRSRLFLALSAVNLGIAMGIKYIMVLLPVPVVLCLLVIEKRNSWRPLLLVTLWAAAWGCWWYLRNFIVAGNPLEPFAANIFGYYSWTAEDLASLYSATNFWIPRTLTAILLLPYYAYQNEALYVQGPFFVITLLYLSTLFAFIANRFTNLLLVFIWIWVVWWVIGSQDPRHLLPVVPLVLVHVALVLGQMLRRMEALFKTSRVKKSFRLFMLVSALAAFVWSALIVRDVVARLYYSGLSPSPYQETLMRGDAVYDLYTHANDYFLDKDTLFEFNERDGRWFFRGNVMGSPFGEHGYLAVLDDAGYPEPASPAKLENILKSRYGASGFIISHSLASFYKQEEFDKHLRLLYRNAEGSVYAWKEK